MGRGEIRRAVSPNAPPAYHQAEEPWTGRRVVMGGEDHGEVRIAYARPFWRSPQEQQAYERAVAEIRPYVRYSSPRPAADDSDAEAKRVDGESWLGMGALCVEIARLAEGLELGRRVQVVPRGMSHGQWTDRQNALKRQLGGER